MDITGWTMEQRMRLPDWCFGNRRIVSCYGWNPNPATFVFTISSSDLPDPCCIWHAMFCSQPTGGGMGRMRIGMSDDVPADDGEMDLVDEIFPDYGSPGPGPNDIDFMEATYTYYAFNIRKGLVTGGQNLVMSTENTAGVMRLMCALVVSELPINMAGWLEHARV